jgi:phosphotransferase family enzyme
MPSEIDRLTPLEAAVELGRRHRLEVREPRILKNGSNVLVHLAPSPVVVRVATFTAVVRGDPLPYLEREVRLTAALVAAGAAVAPPSPLIPPGPHVVGGRAMTALAWVDHVPGAAPDPVSVIDALDSLHAALRTITLDLPLLGPATSDLDLALDATVRHRLLTVDEAHERRSRRDRLLHELLAAAPDRQPLHGDAFPRNSLLDDGRIVWIDLEDCCFGPTAWDHAVLCRQSGDPAVERIIRARDRGPALDLAMALRAIQGEAWTILHDAREAGRIPGWP